MPFDPFQKLFPWYEEYLAYDETQIQQRTARKVLSKLIPLVEQRIEELQGQVIEEVHFSMDDIWDAIDNHLKEFADLKAEVEKDRERLTTLIRWHKQQQDLADWWRQESSPLDELE